MQAKATAQQVGLSQPVTQKSESEVQLITSPAFTWVFKQQKHTWVNSQTKSKVLKQERNT